MTMIRIDLNFQTLISHMFRLSRIKLQGFPIKKPEGTSGEALLDLLKERLYLNTSLFTLDGVVSDFDHSLYITKTTYIHFGSLEYDHPKEIDPKQLLCVLETPEAILLVWDVKFSGHRYFVFRDIMAVTSDIVKIPGLDEVMPTKIPNDSRFKISAREG